MKKLIIGALVGGLIFFTWQFLSWSMLGVHQSSFGYTAQESAVLESMKGLPDGSYMMPGFDPNASKEEHEKLMATMDGKPWAMVQYRNDHQMNMATKMIRSLLMNIVVAFLLAWILMKFRNNDLKESLIASIVIGLTGYFMISYLNNVWFESPSLGFLIDTVVQFGLVGLWLGWWLNRD